MNKTQAKYNIHAQSDLDFKLMSLFFKLRDFFHPPAIKILKSKIKLGDSILDYGCGPGSYSFAALKVIGESGRLFAADINPLALKKVEKKASKRGIENIKMILTYCNTDITDESLDVVICFDVMHNIKEKDTILKEFHRVLKPKSFLLFDDHHLNEDEILSAIADTGLFKLVEKKDKFFNFKKV